MRALTVVGCCLEAGTRHTYREATYSVLMARQYATATIPAQYVKISADTC
jgi:hypothetical protein